MIDKNHGKICLVCDDCQDTTDDYDGDEFALMIRDAKNDGWLITRDDKTGEYSHMCPDCVDDLPKVAS
jgi:hypothetical protein